MSRRKKQVTGRGRSLVRLLTLISLLKRRRPSSWQQLAQKLGVGERTVQRDMAILVQAGFRVKYASRENGLRVFWLPSDDAKPRKRKQ